jgi:MFS family permease
VTTADPGPAPVRPASLGNPAPGAGLRLGLRANLAQFSLLVVVNALVGGTLGQERTVVPLLAARTFHLAAFTSALTFILAFGAVKAITNFFAGTLSDRFGRKPVLVSGWLVALPIPPLLIFAPNWGWVVAANALLGVNQGLTWSTTVIMKIDLVGPARRGLAMGLNEAAGYGAVAITALATGYLAAAYGLRPAPFLLGAAYIALGLGLSATVVRETRQYARHEAATHIAADHLGGHLTTSQVARLTSFSEPALSAACQAGMVNNLNDGLAWGLFPILFARHGLSVSQIGILAALYPAVWGAGQLGTGALSDRIGRKWLIAAGMGVQAGAIALIALGTTFAVWAVAAVLLGAGTAMVYPTLLAAVGDVAHPAWRARSVGVYRLWRDGGFAVGALLTGLIADAFGILSAIWVVAALTAVSGLVVAVRMYETRPAAGKRMAMR